MLKQIRWTTLAIAGLSGSWSLFADSAAAQFSTSGNTGTSAFGSRTLGGSTSSNRTGRSTGAANAGSLTGGTGTGGTGTTAGALGTGAPTGERYVRGNRSGAFVGADTGDGAANSYSQQAGAGGMAGGAGGLGGMMGNQMMMQAFRQVNKELKPASSSKAS